MTDEPAAPGVWVALPDGYAPLPLEDVPAVIATTAGLIGPDPVLGTLEVLLTTLAARNAAYCGVGRHLSALGGGLVTSSLVIALMAVPGARNPRLVLKELLRGKRDAGEAGQVDLVDLANGPVLFFERVLLLPGLTDGELDQVWQLEAFVPSPDGDQLATIELSTPFVDDGPQFRAMVVGMAASVGFRPPVEDDPLAALLG
jgi:hypothetical protein